MDTKENKKKLAKVGRKDLAYEIAHMEGISQTQAERIISRVFRQILYFTIERKLVDIPGFGKFFAKYVPERTGSHPQTHETIKIGPNVQMRAEFSSTVKNQLNHYVERFAELAHGEKKPE